MRMRRIGLWLGSATVARAPAFANDFPRTPELDALVHAFACGDYRRVRAEGGKLAASAPEENVRAAARSIVARTTPDPLAIGLLLLAAGLLVVLSTYWIVHGKAPSGTGAPTAPRVGCGSARPARSALGLV